MNENGIHEENCKIETTIYQLIRGGPKNNRIIFFKWFIRFYTITTLVSFKVLFF